MRSSSYQVSVVIPTYCEVGRLPRTLAEIRPYFVARQIRHEIVVVDDNSPDGTGAFVSGLADPDIRLLSQPRRLGKGAALRRGCLAARGELILYMDADHATPITSLDAFLPLVQRGRDCLIAGVRTYQEDESRLRRIIGLAGQLLAHLVVFERAVVDSQCGFKVLTHGAAQKLFSRTRTNGGMIDVELFFLAHRLRVPTFFVPVHWRNKPGSKINLFACMFFDSLELFRIRARSLFGLYHQTKVKAPPLESPESKQEGEVEGRSA